MQENTTSLPKYIKFIIKTSIEKAIGSTISDTQSSFAYEH